MRELLIQKGTEQDPLPRIWEKETGRTLYRLVLEEDGLWRRLYRMTGPDGETAGTLEYRHEAFRLARMPRILGSLGGKEEFLLKREIEALRDILEVEGKDLRVEGTIPAGEFRLIREGRCLARFCYNKGEKEIIPEENEPLAALFALALELL